MARDHRADPNCNFCRGSGTIISDEKIIDGEYWCSFMDCHCIPAPELSERKKALLAKVLSKEATLWPPNT